MAASGGPLCVEAMTADSTAHEYLIGSTRLRLVQGDLTVLAVDAIVNAANDEQAFMAYASAVEGLV